MAQLSLLQADGLVGPSVLFVILILALATAAFVLYGRYRSRQRLVHRVAELEALSAAGRAIVAAQLDLDALCELIAGQAGQVIENSTFQIGLFEANLYHILFWTIGDVRQPTPQTFNLSENGGVVGWIRESKSPLLVHDFLREMDSLPARPRYISSSPPRSAIFIPLISGDLVLGVMAAQNTQPDRFGQRDMDRLTILANQAAAAIANAQLYEQERTRAAHLALVSQIARQVNAINDLDELFSQVVVLTQQTFGFSSVNIFGIDSQTGEAVARASSAPQLRPGSVRLAPGQGLIGTAVATGQSTLSNNTLTDERFLIGPVSAGTRSEIAIPLIVDEELLGVLDVQSQELEAFTSREQTVLEALAAQVAIAIHKAHQFALQREQAWLTTAQLQVAEATSQSASLEELVETLVRLTALLVGVDQCAILLWDEDSGVYQGMAIFGLTGPAVARFKQTRLAIGRWPALDAVHVGHQKLATQQRPPWLTRTRAKARRPATNVAGAYTLWPLVAKGRNLGVLVVHGEPAGDRPETMTNGREEVLRSIAGQAAQAIESLQLQTAQQEEAWVNTALLQVAEAVNRLTNLNEILDTIARMVPLLVGVRVCIILFWDEREQLFRAGPSFGLSEMEEGLLRSFEMDLSEFPLVETQDVEQAGPDTVYYTIQLPQWMRAMVGAAKADTFPLHARARLVGALIVGPPLNGRPLSGRRLNIINGIAQQAAIAVVNDQLYKESAERSRIEQELNVARSIQASLIPAGRPEIPGCDVAGFWEAARMVSGDFYDFMPLANGAWGIAVADVADKGVPAALFMALSRTILRTVAISRDRPAEVLERANQIIFNDSQSDLFVTVFYAIWNPETEMLTYASGGHNPALLLRSNGQTSLLQSDGIALGVLEEVRIQQKETRLRPGDIVVFYTDGVTEAVNEDLDEFGLDRLCLIAQKARDQDAAGIVAAITNAVQDHAGDASQFDDVTLVVVKTLP
ncbi:MAG: SpoIIE family protein phosphatase [Chloroflexi bacterium]|nr:SpoIIE family protein phosphatase [Chloroflexota bacterium]MCI0576211.1 SpoIIE family protein phosphatase [Chloroflexota bacterium]MCI0645495.1 SpoIIE family protein phosphatase [Chloroflexota bacterium]MCI0730634.1 SpoIIE family protein phosphatase [Chloroflexota bacterium]